MKGICFKEPLHLKVVAGEKIKTRRLIFPKTDYTLFSQPSFEGMETDPDSALRTDKEGDTICNKEGEEKLFSLKGTYGLFEGDQFYFECAYVRPRYQPGEIVFLKEPYWLDENRIHYKYDGLTTLVFGMWKNKLFMPEQYARHFIQIISATAERAWEITEADAIAEGCKNRAEFESLWMQINGISSWKDNPWVWVYEFKLINKTT